PRGRQYCQCQCKHDAGCLESPAAGSARALAPGGQRRRSLAGPCAAGDEFGLSSPDGQDSRIGRKFRHDSCQPGILGRANQRSGAKRGNLMQQQIRSALFVPATRPERFSKALAAGADTVIIDLEDAVEYAFKDEARKHLCDFASANRQADFCVRINGATTPWFNADLAACADHPNIRAVLLPKAESALQIQQVAQAV